MMKEANIEGFFTNHSLRHSGGTRLFRAGVDCKLVKEVTGHRSGAVDRYQITSHEQHEKMSKIIAKAPSTTVSVNPNPETEKEAPECANKLHSNEAKDTKSHDCTCQLS